MLSGFEIFKFFVSDHLKHELKNSVAQMVFKTQRLNL